MNSNPLSDILPAQVRKYLYAFVFVGLLVFAALNVADGDWSQVVLSLLTSLAPLLAASNVTTQVPAPDDLDEDDYADEPEQTGPVANKSRLTLDDMPLRRTDPTDTGVTDQDV